MAVVLRCPQVAASCWLRPIRCSSARTRLTICLSTLHNNDRNSSLPPAVLQAANIRFKESNRPDPLVIDPYIGCFLASAMDAEEEKREEDKEEVVKCSTYLGLSTRFIDDMLIDVMTRDEEVRQVVLLTDGIDTRPYRLQWPRSTLVFDVSLTEVFTDASRRLQGHGAKIARNCLLLHIPFGQYNLQELLCQKGFNASIPSIWILQGLPFTTLEELQQILYVVSSLATKGCIFLGELPCWLFKAESRNELEQNKVQKWMDRTFMSNGFRVDIIDYKEIAKKLQRHHPTVAQNNVLFVAHQLQLSDGQMELWRMEYQRLEEEGDEEGFVDMLS